MTPAIFVDHRVEAELVNAFFAGQARLDGKRPQDRRFVEVGANDPFDLSQSWHLEQQGWRGLLIEPIPANVNKLRQHRQADVVEAACCAPAQHGQTATLYVGGVNGAHSSLRPDLAVPESRTGQAIQVPLRTLQSVLQAHGLAGRGSVDLLSIDTEGTEVDVLQGLDLAACQPVLILIEDLVHDHSKHQHLVNAGYRWFRRTGLNSWYVPKTSPHRPSWYGQLQFGRKYWVGLPVRRWRAARRAARAAALQAKA